MKKKLQKVRSIKVIDLLRAISVFDFLLILLVLVVPAVIVAKGKPISKQPSGGGSDVKITAIDPEEGPIGGLITVYGTGFTDNNSIKIKGTIVLSGLSSLDGSTLIFRLPPDTPCSPPSACPVKVVVENQQGESNAFPFKVTHDPLPPNLVIITETLPDGVENQSYSALLEAEGGISPYSWSVIEGLLPTGLNLDSNTGIISGTPSLKGVSVFTVQAQDETGDIVSKEFQITINPAQVVTFDPVTIIGRFVDYFTGEPISGVTFFNYNAPDAITQSSQDGSFSVTIGTSDIQAVSGGGMGKSVGYWSTCYFTQSMGVWKNEDSTLRVESSTFDLGPNLQFPVTSEIVDIGDVKVWPATEIEMYFDQEMQPWIWYPEEGLGKGSVNYMTDTVNKALGGYIVPFGYPLTVELKDKDGNSYQHYGYEQDRSTGCGSTATLRFSNGEFNWTSE